MHCNYREYLSMRRSWCSQSISFSKDTQTSSMLNIYNETNFSKGLLYSSFSRQHTKILKDRGYACWSGQVAILSPKIRQGQYWSHLLWFNPSLNHRMLRLSFQVMSYNFCVQESHIATVRELWARSIYRRTYLLSVWKKVMLKVDTLLRSSTQCTSIVTFGHKVLY